MAEAETTPPDKPPEPVAISIMDMPQISGVSLRLSHQQGSRRSSMFESQPRSFHGKIETHSRGSFSLKGLVDPAVGLIDKSQEVVNDQTSLSHLPDLPNDLVYQTESKETIDSSSLKKKMAPQFENTYQLEPVRKPKRKELADMLRRVKEEIPADKLNLTDFKATTTLGQDLANQVLAECHKLELARYRFLCMSTVISREGTSAQQASRQLWDHNRDTWDETSITLPNAHIFIQLYCIYLD